MDRRTVADVETSGQTYYYLADGLGSVTAFLDGSGQIVATYQYDSFGNIVSHSGTVEQPFRYTGREYDAETGLYYYRARYYDARNGRFLQEDPVWDANLYAYVGNKPVNWVDPWGLDATGISGMGPPVVFPGGRLPGFDGVLSGTGTGTGSDSGKSCTKGAAGETDGGTSKKGTDGKGSQIREKGSKSKLLVQSRGILKIFAGVKQKGIKRQESLG